MTSQKYEFFYGDAKLGHHHAYLAKPLLAMIDEFASSIQKQQSCRILDIGCGNGSLTNLIAKHGNEVIGLDESESGVKFANESFPNCQFIQGSIYDIPYTELGNKFDVVIACEVIEHLFYPKELVRNAKKMSQA